MENNENKMEETTLTEEKLQQAPVEDTIEETVDETVLVAEEEVVAEVEELPAEESPVAESAEELPVEETAEEEFCLDEFSRYCEEHIATEKKPVAEKKISVVLSYLHDLVFGLVAILLVFMLFLLFRQLP